MKVLGLVGSVRRLGNSEILTKEALMGAEQEGAEVEILRLTDYEVRACQGGGTCLFQGKDCVIEDDARFIFAKMAASDGSNAAGEELAREIIEEMDGWW